MFSKLRDKLKNFLGSKETLEEPKPKKEISKKESKKIREKPEKTSKKITKSKPVKDKEIEEPLQQEEISKIKTEELKEEELEKKPSFLSRFAKKISLSTTTLEKEHIDEIFEPLEFILLENNVALEVVDRIKENLSKDLIGIEVKKGTIEKTISDSLKESISSVLVEAPDLIEEIKKKSGVYTIVFFGINGSGKTTSLAKLAYKLKSNGISCVFAAGDTFRAASIEQLEKHASNLGLNVIKQQYGSDPAAVAFDAKKYAEKNKIKCLLIDTAGRMYTKENLIKEMEKIIRVIKPDLKIFVGESIAGNDSIEQAKTFNEAIGIDGIILSKADVDEKGGTALSVSYVTGKPIYFLGEGQDYKDLIEFKKSAILNSLGLE
ncbi:signal recognition particle-docking protein FtsY [Candidatus Pacearchaeota archaeon CG10_big_fil_rev_8_21_14_0_10_34_76]|nr:MAG: signal recognition particle-docking protein FtsY [Candidatus Pacearchaeota archaeon CG10_big_fil_rev_8_21_14_0_10_34_76]